MTLFEQKENHGLNMYNLISQNSLCIVTKKAKNITIENRKNNIFTVDNRNNNCDR